MGVPKEIAAAPSPQLAMSAALAPRRRMRRGDGGWLTGATLLLGIAAMLLAILPPLIYDEPLKWPWQDDRKPSATATDGTVTVTGKSFSFTIGREKTQPTPPVAQPPSPTKPYYIAMVITALAGVGLAALAWVRERHRSVVVVGATLCCAALVWQYVVIGLAVGAAVVAILMILSALSA